MDGYILTWVFGGATLIGLLLQVLGAFSKYKEIRNAISLVVFGVFLGTIIGAISPNSVSLALQVGWLELLLTLLGGTVVASVIATEIRSDQSNDGFVGLAMFAGFLFCAVLVFGSIAKFDAASDKNKGQFRVEELIALKDFNISRQNYDKAIIALNKAKYEMPMNDSRRQIIEKEIESIKLKQIE